MFKNFIKKNPMAIGGLTLGIVSLGNLLGGVAAPIFALISALMGFIFIIRLLAYPELLKEELHDPVAISVAPTFAMAMVMLSKFYSEYINFTLGKVIFYLGVLLHFLIIIYFLVNYRHLLTREKVYGSFMIVFGSFGAGSIVAPYYGAHNLGRLVWIFGMVTFLPILYMVLYKDRHFPEEDESKMPLVCIAASNGGLLLTGYFNSFIDYSFAFIIFMIILGQAVYFLAVSKLPKLLKLKFYPSYSSFTFPFVINATALKLTRQYLSLQGISSGFISLVLWFETALAIILVSYVLFSYIKYLFK